MSVQAGIWNFDGRPVDFKLLADISESLKHQGPDGESHYGDGCIALLYRPFHTTAESRREKQPYISRRGFVITWDGRLDNREDLIADLGGDVEVESTDIEIVAAAFDSSEADCFRHIIGDWAVSIWKPHQRELTFAVDYMGIRHIFYSLKRDRILWSSDLSPLVLSSADELHIDDDYIAGYFAHDPDAHLTPYHEIREVPPGQVVRIRASGTSIERHWRFNPKSRIRYKSDEQYEEHFRSVFRQSVRRRLRSDSPVLAELSGGLDSSSIVCMADDILGKEGAQAPRLDTLSYYDKTEPHGDDWVYFEKIEGHRGRTGHHIDGSRSGTAPASLEHTEFKPLPGYLSSKRNIEAERVDFVRAGRYRAVFSGIGGDEFLGGIPNPTAQLADLIVQGRLVKLTQQLTAWSLVKRRPWTHLLWDAAVDLLPVPLGQHLSQLAKVEPWINRDFAKRTRLASRLIALDEHFGLWLPTRRSYIAGVLLMANKMAKLPSSSRHVEETRFPYLDQNVIEFILSIPAFQLLRPGERRSLMRRSLAGLVPHDILARTTKQFSARTPVVGLERNSDYLQLIFESSLSSRLGYIDNTGFLAALKATRDGASISISRLMRTIALELWLRDLVSRRLIHDTMGTHDSLERTSSRSERVVPALNKFHHSDC